jgi:hypothetical protein
MRTTRISIPVCVGLFASLLIMGAEYGIAGEKYEPGDQYKNDEGLIATITKVTDGGKYLYYRTNKFADDTPDIMFNIESFESFLEQYKLKPAGKGKIPESSSELKADRKAKEEAKSSDQDKRSARRELHRIEGHPVFTAT